MRSTYFREAAEIYARLAADGAALDFAAEAGATMIAALGAGGKILFAGNGGSAADCQHLAGELIVRFRRDRQGLPGIALTVDTSVLTAALNDYGAERVYARQVEAIGAAGDVLCAFSTSGNSENILLACETAKARGLKTLGFTGRKGGGLAAVSDAVFRAPSEITSHIQECHIAMGHLLCDLVESHYAGETR